MDVSRMKEAGWTYNIEIKNGIKATYEWFLENLDKIKEVEIES
jgi:GDP-L-fucose synthase